MTTPAVWTNENTFMQGWLVKDKRQNSAPSQMKNMLGTKKTKRWFRVTYINELLEGGPPMTATETRKDALSLCYYAGPKHIEQPKGWLALSSATKIMGVTPTCFVIEHPKRSFILHTSSKAELKDWVSILERLVDLAKKDEFKLRNPTRGSSNINGYTSSCSSSSSMKARVLDRSDDDSDDDSRRRSPRRRSNSRSQSPERRRRRRTPSPQRGDDARDEQEDDFAPPAYRSRVTQLPKQPDLASLADDLEVADEKRVPLKEEHANTTGVVVVQRSAIRVKRFAQQETKEEPPSPPPPQYIYGSRVVSPKEAETPLQPPPSPVVSEKRPKSSRRKSKTEKKKKKTPTTEPPTEEEKTSPTSPTSPKTPLFDAKKKRQVRKL